MISCPKCGDDYPELRKLSYGYNGLIIMDQSRAKAIAEKEAELTGKKVHIEMLDFDKDENAVSQSIKEEVTKALEEEA